MVAAFTGIGSRPAHAQDASQQILDAVNAARAQSGLAPLSEHPLLTQAAQNHVNDMINNYVYGHYGSDGSTVHMRVARTGYAAQPWVSENWVSASSPDGAMRWWMNDYIHRVNILTDRWTEIGIGVGTRGSEMIFVTVFSAGGGVGSENVVVAQAPPPQQEAPPPSVKIEQVVVPPEGVDYAVRSGDTLLAIGLRYGLPWETVAAANGLNERSILQIGQNIRIPGSGAPAAPPVPDVETEEYVVQPNDTLYSIAAQRGLFWDDVAVVNGFGEQTVLQIGQTIKVPVVEEAEEAVDETAVAAIADQTAAAGTNETAASAEIGPVMQTPRSNSFDERTLLALDPAQKAQAAKVAATGDYPGTGGPTANVAQAAATQSEGAGATSAVLAAHAASTEIVPASEPASYEVQPGDTIISIAVKHNVSWDALLSLNGLTENSVLQLGQTIRLR
jgi:LysM repeat protein